MMELKKNAVDIASKIVKDETYNLDQVKELYSLICKLHLGEKFETLRGIEAESDLYPRGKQINELKGNEKKEAIEDIEAYILDNKTIFIQECKDILKELDK